MSSPSWKLVYFHLSVEKKCRFPRLDLSGNQQTARQRAGGPALIVELL